MTKSEATKVLQTMATADGGCYYCVGKLFNYFIDDFPQYEKLAREIFAVIYGDLTIEQAIKDD